MRYDVVIIGGGPAGMMAAGRAGELGARVLLLEKGDGLGAKLLMTGGGRCNITNNTEDLKLMSARYGKAGRFMRGPLYEFGPNDLVAFFEDRRVKTKVEGKGRVLPVSNDAGSVLDALQSYLGDGGVELMLGAEVREIVKNGNHIDAISLASGEVIEGCYFLIATGGMSYPVSGSTGDGYAFAKVLGHRIIPPRPALTTVITENDMACELQGLSLSDVKVGLYKDNKKTMQDKGDIIFTANGLGGPLVMDMSGEVGKALAHVSVAGSGSVEFRLDFFANIEFKAMEQILIDLCSKSPRKLVRKTLEQKVTQRLAKVIVERAGITDDKISGELTRAERKRLVGLLKEFSFKVKKLSGFERAFITAGGVDIKEVDQKTMRSKIIDNLYLAGEVLDIDGPTGGFNLQVCWSTGYVAGSAMARRITEKE